MALAFAAAYSRVQAQDSIPARGRFVLRGTVRDSTANPVASVLVSVYGSGRSARTNQRGEFEVTGLPHGLQVVEFAALGYKPRILGVVMSDTTPSITTFLMPSHIVMLDSVHVATTREPSEAGRRRRDIISQDELSAPDIASGNAMDALFLLRPQLFNGRPPLTGVVTTDAASRGQFFPRDSSGRCVGNRACSADPMLAVSVNEGPLGSPDLLTSLSVRIIREMRYLPPLEATARFGLSAGGGPVLVVYTK